MGLSGPLPRLRLIEADELPDLSPPGWLCEEAARHWTKHAPWLSANKLLTAATADSFALCCSLWAKVRANDDGTLSRTWLDALKAYGTASKLFRLVPCDKPGKEPAHRHEDKTEFDF